MIDYGISGKTSRALSKFINSSRKLTGTNLNKQPKVKTDYSGNPKLNRSPKGLAHGRPTDDRLNNKPMTVRKVVKGNGKSPSAPAKKSPPRNKGMVRKYK